MEDERIFIELVVLNSKNRPILSVGTSELNLNWIYDSTKIVGENTIRIYL